MASEKLTDRKIKALVAVGRYNDGKGLYFRVREGSSRSWVYVDKRGGKAREMSLGPYPAISLADAREKAAQIRTQIAKGEELQPKATNAPTTPEKTASAPLFGEYALAFVDSIKSGFKSAKHRAQWSSTLQEYAKPLWKMRLDEITTDDVLACLRPIWATKTETASRVRGRIERVLDAAKVQGHRIGDNPAVWGGRLSLLLPARSKLQRGHHPAMPWQDLPSFWSKLAGLSSMSAEVLKFTILTACRSGESRGALWSEIDLQAAVWTIPAERMKAAKEHRVALSAPALAILTRLQALGDDWLVFPSTKAGRPMTDMAMMMCLRDQAPGFTVHGFRSTFSDWANDQTDHPFEVIEGALAHTVGNAVARAYRRGDGLEKRRPLMDDWAMFVTGDSRGLSNR